MNTNDTYRLTDIKGIIIQPNDTQLIDRTSITLNNDLYISKSGSNYVIFQISPNLDYNIDHLEVIKRCIKLSSVFITFVSTTKDDKHIKRFRTKDIDLKAMVNSVKYASSNYVTSIIIPTLHTEFDLTEFDLKKYVSDLYMIYSGNNINIRTDYYGMFPVQQLYTRSELQIDNTKALMNIDHCKCMYDYITDNEDIFIPDIEKVIFNDPATIVFWDDGTKTVVRTQNNEKYDKEKGLAMAISKKMLGNNSKYYDTFKKWIK